MTAAKKGTAGSEAVGGFNYSMAFLYAYDGNLASAIRHYRRATKSVVSIGMLTQIEDFICWVLEREPDKYQLHYCLGFFNWKAKGDLVRALKDFEKFLELRHEDEFNKERELAEKWMAELAPAGSVRSSV